MSKNKKVIKSTVEKDGMLVIEPMPNANHELVLGSAIDLCHGKNQKGVVVFGENVVTIEPSFTEALVPKIVSNLRSGAYTDRTAALGYSKSIQGTALNA